MTTLFGDTLKEIEDIQLSLMREMTADRKLELVSELSSTAVQMARVGLEQRYPNASDGEIQRYLADLVLGEDLARQVYGELSEVG